jgi:hypothetical protein
MNDKKNIRDGFFFIRVLNGRRIAEEKAIETTIEFFRSLS